MKKTILLVIPFASVLFSFGQQKDGADKLVSDGVTLQDKGYADSAMALYKKALDLDKDNLLALSEMGYSLLSEQKYEDAMDYCQRAIKIHKNDPGLKTVYVAYGNALDGLGKTAKALDIYDEGIKRFPDYAQLYFNKGISLSGLNKIDQAIPCFQKSASLDPEHAGSHNAIGRVLFASNKVPSLMALCRFLTLEQNTDRARQNLSNVKKILYGNVTKTGEKSITINLSADMLDTKKMDDPNGFASTDLILSLAAATDGDSSQKDQSEVARFIQIMNTVVGSLSELQKGRQGFYWNYYVPYFVEMKSRNLMKTFGYIVFASSNDDAVSGWIKTHPTEMEAFKNWSDSFSWNGK